jgi:acyl-CoA synthetase (AMP-forming)/AMP-acid ligase II
MISESRLWSECSELRNPMLSIHDEIRSDQETPREEKLQMARNLVEAYADSWQRYWMLNFKPVGLMMPTRESFIIAFIGSVMSLGAALVLILKYRPHRMP